LAAEGSERAHTVTKPTYITVAPPTSTVTASWNLLLYFAGDNDQHTNLEYALEDLERVAGNPNVNSLVLWDGVSGNSVEDGDTRLYQVAYHPAPGLGSPVIPVGWNSGEMNTGDPQTLMDFVTWARASYPAAHTLLAIADHGRGTTGIAWDATSEGDLLTVYDELGAALITLAENGHKLDVLFLDACLMAMLETVYEVKDTVDYVVASENLGWSVFAYGDYVAAITANTTPDQLAAHIAQTYFAALYEYPGTISVIETAQVDAVGAAVDALALALQAYMTSSTITDVVTVRDSVQTFDSRGYYVLDSSDEYVDLYHLAELLLGLPSVPPVRRKTFISPTVTAAAQGVLDAVATAVFTEYHQSGLHPTSGNIWSLDCAHGLSIYFPPFSNGWDYGAYVLTGTWAFTGATAWDEFLADYFALAGLLPEPPEAPDLPPLPQALVPIFSEDWEPSDSELAGWESSNIDATVWKAFGTPLPLVVAGVGLEGTYALDPNGDGNYDSGLVTRSPLSLTPGIQMTFWLRGHGLLGGQYSNAWVGLGQCPPDDVVELCRDYVIHIRISAEEEHVVYNVNTKGGFEYEREPWSPLDDTWHKYSFVIDDAGLVAFYRDDTLRFQTTMPVDFERDAKVWVDVRGRSVNSYYYVDDIVVMGTSEARAVDVTRIYLPMVLRL
ncbi:MAG: hypothetical protein JXA33_26675, partial [Anaerolineae bacterium]|nr:hypothetical protein [Anaerolineae bacterium]